MSAVTVSLAQLVDGLSLETLEEAFGPDSLGIILVKDLPAHYSTLRTKVLTSITALAQLPQAELEKLESEESLWITGWSRGRETLSKTNQPDFNKGSYYVNCAFHVDPALEGPRKALVEKFADYKTYTTPNIWPRKELAGLESFQEDCKALCNLIISVAEHVARNCDRFISSGHKNYEKNFLERVVRDSTCTKARLLHYYPMENGGDHDDWCGEHTDHSCITGLTSALFLEEKDGSSTVLGEAPDPAAGLYIRNRQVEIKRVSIPADCLAFQTGSTLQEISKNGLKAVSHYVQGTAVPHIARNTLAVFCQPNLDEMVNESENFAQFADRIIKEHH